MARLARRLRPGHLLTLLGLGIGAAYAQIGEPPAAFETQLQDVLELDAAASGLETGALSLETALRGGLLYSVAGEATLNPKGKADLAAVIGAATGYGEGIAEPLATFLDEQTGELIGAGEVKVNVSEYILTLEVTGEVSAPQARFALEPSAITTFPEARHALGAPDAAVVIRAFSDFQCPFCARYAQEVLPQLKDALLTREDVRFEFHHLPLVTIHANAQLAAEAAECVTDANTPEAFWTYHDALFERQQAWSDLGDAAPYFVRLAQEVELSSEGVAACLAEGRYRQAVQNAYEAARQLGISSTPSLFVGPYRVPGAAAGSVAGYEAAIERFLAFSQVPSAESGGGAP